MVSELHTGTAPLAPSSMRPMSFGPPARQIVGRGGAIRPCATSHAAALESVLRRHTMLPLGLWKRSPTPAAGLAASMRLLASSKDFGPPRGGPAARFVGSVKDTATAARTT